MTMGKEGVKTLAKDTAIYGVSSMFGRFLNWCLVPLYTNVFDADEYGIVTLIYSITALLLIILTYGMETGFFRFANHDRWKDPIQVYTTALSSLIVSSSLFIVIVFLGLDSWARLAECPSHPSFIYIMGITIAIDAFTSLPFAYLRYKRNSLRFASLKLVGIGLNILFNLFFILILPGIADHPVFSWMWNSDFGIGYIFLSNLLSSGITLFLLIPELRVKWSFSRKLFVEMLTYSFPLLILGLAGIMNQSIDKILYPVLASNSPDVMGELGIYGANYKIAIILVMFIQAFRFAYEPFIFSKHREGKRDSSKAYSDSMKWFVIFAMFIFLGVMMMLDIVKWLIAPSYFSGLKVVPIVMLAELFFGIFFNLSVWYKVNDKTYWGTIFSLIGLSVTLGLNAWFVPMWGYMGCAWAAFGCYGVMMLMSWIVGRIKHPIEYDLKSVVFYVTVGVAMWLGITWLISGCELPTVSAWLLKCAAVVAYPVIVLLKEKIPVRGVRKVRSANR